jgi:hypothetical protein
VVERITEYQFSRKFRKDFRTLPKAIQGEFEEKLGLMLENMAHPSLRVKRIQGTKDRWEGSVTKGYRFTFQLTGPLCLFRRIGTHDILKREG